MKWTLNQNLYFIAQTSWFKVRIKKILVKTFFLRLLDLYDPSYFTKVSKKYMAVFTNKF